MAAWMCRRAGRTRPPGRHRKEAHRCKPEEDGSVKLSSSTLSLSDRDKLSQNEGLGAATKLYWICFCLSLRNIFSSTAACRHGRIIQGIEHNASKGNGQSVIGYRNHPLLRTLAIVLGHAWEV